MRLVFIYGLPATGKLTVAKQLAAVTGFRLFHNHLVVDLLLSVFDFGSKPFVALREEIWLSVFREAAGLAGLIFTFAPENTVRPGFIGDVLRTVAEQKGEVSFIELVCPLPELKGRLENASRGQYGKLTSVTMFEVLLAKGALDASHMPRPVLSIDTSQFTPVEAAREIVRTLGLAESGANS